MDYCPKCMRPVSTPLCSYCGTPLTAQNLSPLLPAGTRLKGNNGKSTYQLGLALGKGGFGITYIAVELETGRRVAVKEYFPDLCKWAGRAANGITVEAMPQMESTYNRGRISFLKEARVLASMTEHHPAVVEGLDYIELNNTAYLVMEYLDGQPLFKIVQKKGKLTLDEIAPKFLQLLDGVYWLHKQGIIHRDLCPDNIMWMPDGTLKLVDFGAARKAEGNSQLTVQVKPGYAPPEQYTSGGQGTWTDVYTLAASICYCLTGHDPVTANNRLYAVHGVDDYGNPVTRPDPLQLPPGLTAAQAAALTHAMALQPKDRTQTVDQFRKEFFGDIVIPYIQTPPPVQPPVVHTSTQTQTQTGPVIQTPPQQVPPVAPPPPPPPPQPQPEPGTQKTGLPPSLIASIIIGILVLIVILYGLGNFL